MKRTILAAAFILAAAGALAGPRTRPVNAATTRPGSPQATRPGSPQATRPARQPGRRAKALKANLDSFALHLSYLAVKKEESAGASFSTLRPSAPMPKGRRPGVRISKAQATAIIDHLDKSGALGRLLDPQTLAVIDMQIPIPHLHVQLIAGKHRIENWLPADPKAVDLLEALGKLLDGNAAKAMDKLLKALEPQRKKWQKPAAKQAVKWGKAVGGLVCGISAFKPNVQPGVACQIEVSIKNVSKRKIPLFKQRFSGKSPTVPVVARLFLLRGGRECREGFISDLKRMIVAPAGKEDFVLLKPGDIHRFTRATLIYTHPMAEDVTRKGKYYYFSSRRGSVPKGTWTYVAGTFDRGKMTLYINGRPDLKTVSPTIKRTDPAEYPHDDVVIGGLWNESYNFHGAIDDVGIWKRALSAEEIAAAAGPLAGVGVSRLPLTDRVDTDDSTVLKGTIQNERYALATDFGKIEIAAEKVVRILRALRPQTAARPRVPLVRLILTDGQIITGSLPGQSIVLKMSEGPPLKIPIGSLHQCGYRIDESRPAEPAIAGPMVTLRNHQRLRIADKGPAPRFQADWGKVDLPIGSLLQLEPADWKGTRFRCRLVNGSVLSAAGCMQTAETGWMFRNSDASR